MSHFARRRDGLRLVPFVSDIYDMLLHSKEKLGVTNVSLSSTNPAGGKIRMDIRPLNGKEVVVAVQAPGQKQEIRLVVDDQGSAIEKLNRLLKKKGPVRVRQEPEPPAPAHAPGFYDPNLSV